MEENPASHLTAYRLEKQDARMWTVYLNLFASSESYTVLEQLHSRGDFFFFFYKSAGYQDNESIYYLSELLCCANIN